MADKYILDTNSFIESYKKFYAFDIAPKFWKLLAPVFLSEEVVLIDVVHDEIAKHDDELYKWVTNQNKREVKRENFFKQYIEVVRYIQECGLYNNKALSKWSDYGHADPWTVAAGMATNGVIITFETATGNLSKGSKSGKVKIPDVANHFGVRYENLYAFMRDKGIAL